MVSSGCHVVNIEAEAYDFDFDLVLTVKCRTRSEWTMGQIQNNKDIYIREGFKKKKKYGIFHTFQNPPTPLA